MGNNGREIRGVQKHVSFAGAGSRQSSQAKVRVRCQAVIQGLRCIRIRKKGIAPFRVRHPHPPEKATPFQVGDPSMSLVNNLGRSTSILRLLKCCVRNVRQTNSTVTTVRTSRLHGTLVDRRCRDRQVLSPATRPHRKSQSVERSILLRCLRYALLVRLDARGHKDSFIRATI